MKARIDAISLTVEDLPRAVAFYRDGFGWQPMDVASAPDDHVLFPLEPAGSLVLYLRSALVAATGLPDTGRSALEVVLNYEAPDRATLEAIVAALTAQGGTLVSPPATQAWGGDTAMIADPDGHLWEVATGLSSPPRSSSADHETARQTS